jgi:sirohydrochlorin ferrochelatase
LSYETTCDPNCDPPPPPDLPPTISSTLSCTTWGLNGWCTGSLTLQLTATEPQGKQLQISGDVAGTPFACPAGMGSVNCSVPLPQGTGTANYLATSITGLTASGSATYKHDSTLPQINGSLSGASGDNGWFISQVNVNASASDTLPGSGFSALVYNLNAGGWKSFTGPLNLSDGVHSLSLRASDVAGNVVNTNQTIKVDTVTPALNLSVAGTAGTNGWYRSNVQVAAAVSDSGSGMITLEYDLNGAGWTAYTVPLELSDGIHSLSLRASDAAGNVVDTNQTVKVDTVTPVLDLSVAGTAGTNGWYRSNVQVSADVSDSGSGLNTFEYDLDGAGWTAYTVPLELSDGIHSLSMRTLDAAGNSTTWTQTFQVDTITPLLDLTIGGTLGTGGWYTSLLQISMTASDPGSSPSEVSGLSALEYNLDDTGWAAYSAPLELSDGLYNLDLRAIDAAGNLTSGTKSFRVDAVAPTLEVNVSGTQGASPWYVSIVQVEAVADDVTSDLSTLEVKVDGGDWSAYNAPLAIGDGPHSYRFRATDNAGNQILTPLQSLQVDTIPPAINLPKSWDLGKTVDFELRDNGSGLASVRLVIEDEDERYPKVTWEDALSSYEFDGEINWNGRFQDKSPALPGGEYYATLKVTDNAGNESRMAGQIKVPLISYLETLIDSSGDLVSGTEGSDPIVTLIPGSDSDEAPVSQTPDESAPSTLSFGGESNNAGASGEQSTLGFGGGNNEAGTSGERSALNLGGGNNGAATPSDAKTRKTSFSAGGQSNSPLSNAPSNLLWGATATAAIGAFTAEILRKKQEEEAKAAEKAARTRKPRRKYLSSKNQSQ